MSNKVKAEKGNVSEARKKFVFSGEILRFFLRYNKINIAVVAEEAGCGVDNIRKIFYLELVPYKYRLVMNSVFPAINWLNDDEIFDYFQNKYKPSVISQVKTLLQFTQREIWTIAEKIDFINRRHC